MGSPDSSIVANLYMKYLEEKAFRGTHNPPRLWKMFVDDTFVIQCIENKDNFLQHINNIDSAIQFTRENT